MAAVIDLHTGNALPDHAHPADRPLRRPSFEVIEGGRSAAALRQRRIYRRRRLVAAAGLLIAVLAVAQGVAAVGPHVFGAGPGSEVATSVHRVERGDTLWAVAAAAQPESDPRDVIDRIVEMNSSATDGVRFSPDEPLRVGQRLLVPDAAG